MIITEQSKIDYYGQRSYLTSNLIWTTLIVYDQRWSKHYVMTTNMLLLRYILYLLFYRSILEAIHVLFPLFDFLLKLYPAPCYSHSQTLIAKDSETISDNTMNIVCFTAYILWRHHFNFIQMLLSSDTSNWFAINAKLKGEFASKFESQWVAWISFAITIPTIGNIEKVLIRAGHEWHFRSLYRVLWRMADLSVITKYCW